MNSSGELTNTQNAAKLKKIEELDLYVVARTFLDDVAKTGYHEKLLKDHSLCDWGTLVSTVLPFVGVRIRKHFISVCLLADTRRASISAK